MKKICILTATRAEYGLLKPVIKKLIESNLFDVRLAVTGMHLAVEYGLTYREIESDNIPIDKKIEILLDSNTAVSVSKSMGLATISFAEYFEELKPDLLVVLGDRYETLAVCIAAMNERIPIAHLYGGETTEGAVDESIRHAITKMSYIHFTSTIEYRNRVIQLGEHPDRVFEVGALGIENILKTQLLSKEELEKSIQHKLDKPYAVVTFHPVTLENTNINTQIKELLRALDKHNEYIYIITKANADAGGSVINNVIDKWSYQKENIITVTSLGMLRYLSALKYCSMVIGNSSSGLIEAPTFGIPTINIGDRQKGRLQCESVINCKTEQIAIEKAIQKAMSIEFKLKANGVKNPYGDGNTSEKIVQVIEYYLRENKIDLKKPFYTINLRE